jgi:hypothetical protein
VRAVLDRCACGLPTEVERRTEIPPSPGADISSPTRSGARWFWGWWRGEGNREAEGAKRALRGGWVQHALGKSRRLLGATGRIVAESAREVALRTMSFGSVQRGKHQR